MQIESDHCGHKVFCVFCKVNNKDTMRSTILGLLSRRTFSSLASPPAAKNHVFDQRDLEFQLFEVLNVQKSLFAEGHPRFRQHDVDFVKDALTSAEKIAREWFAPHNRKNDLQEPKFDGKRISMNPEVAQALKQFSEAGLGAAHADEELGGLQLPSCVTNAIMVAFYSANIGTITYPFLTIAAGNMLRKYGSESQIRRFLKPMLEGRFTGTVSLFTKICIIVYV